MATFRLSCHVTVSAYTEVEADSLDEAIKIAGGRDIVLGGVSSGVYEDESWVIEDADGAPMEIEEIE